ncbi:MAG: hypothetical protein H0U07_14235 [Actinobacteria bacterium]|nr:hypothetical protein [Actinomycetota bacterium]
MGLPGSGKSTLARRIGERLSLPVVHLDAHFFLPEWKPRPEDEWTPMARQLVEADAWVMDGAFAMELALERADTIIQLDFPRWRGLLGSVRRNLSGRRSPPADFASGCRERFDRQFLQLLRYVWRYPHTERPTVVASLSALRPDQTLLVARSRSEVERALEVLAGQPR